MLSPIVRIQRVNLFNRKGIKMDCGCGRSPTGKCVGWHALTEEEYQVKLKEYQDKKQK